MDSNLTWRIVKVVIHIETCYAEVLSYGYIGEELVKIRTDNVPVDVDKVGELIHCMIDYLS